MSGALAAICAAIWAYLLAARGHFWLSQSDERTSEARPILDNWPSVTVVVPARDETDCIAASIQSLLRQDYAGPFRVIVVDDNSSDDTAAKAQAVAAQLRSDITVISGTVPPAGWTGKLWALKQGIAGAEALRPDYLLLTDADIVHAPDALASLVARAQSGDFVLCSYMAKLHCASFAERMHVPAFIYFFQMLFPFAWVSRSDRNIAAAAGGCMLIRADCLARIGGIDSIGNDLIDDCALAAKLKRTGPIWLGLTDRVRSIRGYAGFADIRRMIARSAYAQLRYSPLLLVLTLAGMALTFMAPPLLAVFASGWPQYLGLAAWLAMAVSFVPTLRFYGLTVLWAPALPLIAALYSLYTIESAWWHLRRRGGLWKGRVHVNAPSLQ